MVGCRMTRRHWPLLGLAILSVMMTGCSSGARSSSAPITSTPLTGGLSLIAPGLVSASVSSSLNTTTLQVSGGTAPYTWTVQSGTLPAGIILSSGGVLSGTPTAVGGSTITLSVHDASGTPLTATEQISFDIIPTGFTTKMALDEEFNESTLNAALWHYRPGVRDLCTQDASGVTLSNGYLRLSTYSSTSNDVVTNYCGAIDTSTDFTYTYGYWEAAVRFQYQSGGQCAWWIQSPTNGQDLNNPQASGMEMDVFEHTSTNLNPLGYDNALHWDGYTAGIGQSAANRAALPNLDDGNFHIFGVAWTPAGYTFYVDGQVVWTVSSSQAPASSAPEYVILDTELPSPGGVPTAGYGAFGSSSNQYLDVDYVRIYPYAAAP